MTDLLAGGELTRALTTLCTQLHAHDCVLAPNLRLQLDILGDDLGVDVAQWLTDPDGMARRQPPRIDPELRAAMDDYRGRVQATVWESAAWLSDERRARAQRLLEHGEPAEAMRSLAWAIVEESTLVPRSLIAAIRDLSAGLVPPEHLPEGLDDFGFDHEPDATNRRDGPGRGGL